MKNLPLGNLSLDIFLSEYWQKKPVVIRNAIPNFQPIIEPDELAGLACEEEVESRLIIQDNSSTSHNTTSLKNGPFSEDDFNNLPDSPWTLLVQAVDHWLPEANDLLRLFDFIPQWRIDDLMVSYATKGGGVGPHYDNYDVFLLQASGQREWQYGGEFDSHSPRKNHSNLMLLADWHAENTVVLNPGDMLYIPPKIGHNGIAVTDDCTTYSIGFRAPSHSEVLTHFTDFVSHELSNEKRYTDKHLIPQKHSAQITKTSVNEVKNILQHYIDQPDLIEQWFGSYMTEHKYADQQPLYLDESIEEIIDAIKESNTLSKILGSRLAFTINEKNEMQLYANGEYHYIDQDEHDFVIQLTEQQSLQISDIQDSTKRITLLSHLIKAGVYEIE